MLQAASLPSLYFQAYGEPALVPQLKAQLVRQERRLKAAPGWWPVKLRPSSLKVRFLPDFQYLLEPAAGVCLLGCGVLACREAWKSIPNPRLKKCDEARGRH